jgi:hypothetical protein
VRRGFVSMLRSEFRQWVVLANSHYIEPKVGLRVVLRDTLAFGVHHAQVALRCSDILLSRLAPPESGLSVVLKHTRAAVVQTPELVLRVSVTLFSRLAKPRCRLGVVLRNVLAKLVGETEFPLCLGFATGCLLFQGGDDVLGARNRRTNVELSISFVEILFEVTAAFRG